MRVCLNCQLAAPPDVNPLHLCSPLRYTITTTQHNGIWTTVSRDYEKKIMIETYSNVKQISVINEKKMYKVVTDENGDKTCYNLTISYLMKRRCLPEGAALLSNLAVDTVPQATNVTRWRRGSEIYIFGNVYGITYQLNADGYGKNVSNPTLADESMFHVPDICPKPVKPVTLCSPLRYTVTTTNRNQAVSIKSWDYEKNIMNMYSLSFNKRYIYFYNENKVYSITNNENGEYSHCEINLINAFNMKSRCLTASDWFTTSHSAVDTVPQATYVTRWTDPYTPYTYIFGEVDGITYQLDEWNVKVSNPRLADESVFQLPDICTSGLRGTPLSPHGLPLPVRPCSPHRYTLTITTSYNYGAVNLLSRDYEKNIQVWDQSVMKIIYFGNEKKMYEITYGNKCKVTLNYPLYMKSRCVPYGGVFESHLDLETVPEATNVTSWRKGSESFIFGNVYGTTYQLDDTYGTVSYPRLADESVFKLPDICASLDN